MILMSIDTNVAKITMTQRAREVTEHRARANELEKSAAIEEVVMAIRREEEKKKVYNKRTDDYEGHLSG
jgi:hypothetical protein